MTGNKKRYQVLGDRKQTDECEHLEQYKQLKPTYSIRTKSIYAAELQKGPDLKVPGTSEGISTHNDSKYRSDWKAF